MSSVHYNVDNFFDYPSIIVVEIEERLILFDSKENEEVLLSDTVPEFLGRFRRVNHDGGLVPQSKVLEVLIPKGHKVIIRLDGTVGVLSIDGSYFEFSKYINGALIKVPFPDNEFGDFHSYTGMTMTNFNHLLDSYRVNHTVNIEEFDLPLCIDELFLMNELEEL